MHFFMPLCLSAFKDRTYSSENIKTDMNVKKLAYESSTTAVTLFWKTIS